MLKWIEHKIPNSDEVSFSATIGSLNLWAENYYWGVQIAGSYNDIAEGTTDGIDSSKREAEEWLGTFFMPIVKHTIAEVVGTEVFDGRTNALQLKASEVLNTILETISENNYIENGEQGTDTPTDIGGGDL